MKCLKCGGQAFDETKLTTRQINWLLDLELCRHCNPSVLIAMTRDEMDELEIPLNMARFFLDGIHNENGKWEPIHNLTEE